MNRKASKLVVATTAIALSTALLVGGTYALLSDEAKITNHLVSGALNMTLERTSLTSYFVNDDGVYPSQPVVNTGKVDFSAKTSENVFGLTSGTLFTPLCWCEAEMTLTNNSDVAFSYYVEIVVDTANTDMVLAQQIEVSIVADSGASQSGTLGSGLTLGSKGQPIDTLTINAATGNTASFTLKVSFPDKGDANNDAQGKQVSFDLVVYAFQATKL